MKEKFCILLMIIILIFNFSINNSIRSSRTRIGNRTVENGERYSTWKKKAIDVLSMNTTKPEIKKIPELREITKRETGPKREGALFSGNSPRWSGNY